MKVITPAKPFFKFVPRLNPSFSVFSLDNGMIVQSNIQSNEVVFLSTVLFTEGQTYSFTITSEEGIIYKGKMIFLKNGTDVQNYNAQTQDTKRWT